MDKITVKQKELIDAEFMAIPFVADIFMEEVQIGCFSEIKRKSFPKTLELAKKFKLYVIGISTLKKRRLQSKSRERGTRNFRKD